MNLLFLVVYCVRTKVKFLFDPYVMKNGELEFEIIFLIINESKNTRENSKNS